MRIVSFSLASSHWQIQITKVNWVGQWSSFAACPLSLLLKRQNPQSSFRPHAHSTSCSSATMNWITSRAVDCPAEFQSSLQPSPWQLHDVYNCVFHVLESKEFKFLYFILLTYDPALWVSQMYLDSSSRLVQPLATVDFSPSIAENNCLCILSTLSIVLFTFYFVLWALNVSLSTI